MNFIQTVEADAQIALNFCKTELVHLRDEGQKVLAWVEKEVPDSAGGIAVFMQGAEGSAATLAKYAANGLSKQIANGGDSMETFLLNLIQDTHLADNAEGALKAIDVSGVALVESIATSLVKTGLASLLAKLAPAVAAAL